MPIDRSLVGDAATAMCRDCGVPVPGAFEVCARCLWKRDFTQSDREIHQRSMRRALLEFRASCTYGPRDEAG